MLSKARDVLFIVAMIMCGIYSLGKMAALDDCALLGSPVNAKMVRDKLPPIFRHGYASEIDGCMRLD